MVSVLSLMTSSSLSRINEILIDIINYIVVPKIISISKRINNIRSLFSRTRTHQHSSFLSRLTLDLRMSQNISQITLFDVFEQLFLLLHSPLPSILLHCGLSFLCPSCIFGHSLSRFLHLLGSSQTSFRDLSLLWLRLEIGNCSSWLVKLSISILIWSLQTLSHLLLGAKLIVVGILKLLHLVLPGRTNLLPSFWWGWLLLLNWILRFTRWRRLLVSISLGDDWHIRYFIFLNASSRSWSTLSSISMSLASSCRGHTGSTSRSSLLIGGLSCRESTDLLKMHLWV